MFSGDAGLEDEIETGKVLKAVTNELRGQSSVMA
jgi:hypothetical protein